MERGRGAGSVHHMVVSLLATLLFIQALRAFFAGVYYLNLVTLSINVSVLYVLLLFSPLLYLVYRPRSGRILVLCTALLVASRIGMNLSWGTEIYTPLAGLAAASYLVLLPSLLCLSKSEGGAGWLAVGGGVALALAIDAILLLLTLSWDLSAAGLRGLYFTVPMGALAVVISFPVRRVLIAEGSKESPTRWKGRLAGLSLGAWIFLEYAVLATPFGLARWNTAPLIAVSAGSVVGLLVPVAWATRPFAEPTRPLYLTLLGALAFAFVLDHTLFHSLLLPFLLVPAQAAMVITLFRILAVLEGQSLRGTAGALLYSSLVLLLLVFAFVFSLTYGYVPLSSLWEGAEVVLMPVAALVVLLGVSTLTKGFREPLSFPRLPRRVLAFIVVLLLLLSAGLFPNPVSTPPSGNFVTVVSYNIHQGFNNRGVLDPEVYARVLEVADPDLVALQESDTARLTSGNLDVVGYLAARLGYHSYYGPPTSTQSFGIALLSRYPILEAGYISLPSTVDHRALLEARLEVGGTDLWVFVTHFALGREDRQAEVQEVLARTQRVGGPVIIAGDFNSCPDGLCPEYEDGPDTVYQSIIALYNDVWTEAGFGMNDPGGYTFSSSEPFERIDYIFVSTDITTSSAERIRTDLAVEASDHLPVLAVLEVGS